MKYSKCFFSFVVGGYLLSSATVWAKRENDPKSLFVPYQPGKTETYVINTTGYCIALSRPDGKDIKNKHFFELGDGHGNFLPADHPAKLDIFYIPSLPSDTRTECKNDMNNPKIKIKTKKGVHFNLTVVDVKKPDES
ncbi:hypothetical protein QUF31_06735 [Dickeya chrysanthemi]|uniref:hypothetical protein n=1 Tax=Dickeya chrysanthemi TaxID=556 RepID=UPI000577F412|nr:hypothetical protein [Dickeya chrysanthemi]WJM86791.1 hypothetical protein QUF31_06735 [Dickeya chrysanthemi]